MYLRQMMRRLEKAGLDEQTILAQMAAAETEGWEPVRVGPNGDFIQGYRCLACGAQLRWPADHPCKPAPPAGGPPIKGGDEPDPA